MLVPVKSNAIHESNQLRVDRSDLIEDRPLRLLGVFLLAIACVAIFNRLFSKSLFPAPDFYESPFLVLAALNAAFIYHTSLALAGLVVATLAMLYFVQRFTWSDLAGVQVRRFVLFIAFLVVWRQSSYGYNHFFDATHNADRLILIALFLFSFWRPAFLGLIPPMVFLMQGQLSLGHMAYTTAEFSMPLKVIVGFCSLMLVGLFSMRRFDSAFVWATVVVIMAHYWTPAYAKIMINWHEFGQVHLMMAGSYAGGWLSFLDTEAISTLLKNLSQFDKLAMGFTLLFESIVILALFNRLLLALLLLSAAVFHVAVVLVSGIWFWQWLLVDLAFIYFVLIKPDKQHFSTYSFPIYSRVIGAVLITSTPFWAGVPKLGWHDSPVSYIYQIRAYDGENNSTVLKPAYFTPYEYPLTLNSLQFLSESKILPISWGSSRDLALVKTLASVSDSEQIFDIIEQQGSVQFDGERARNFDQFIKKFVIHKQADAGEKRWFDFAFAPNYLYTSFRSRQIVDSVIERVKVHRLTSWFDGTTFRTIDDSMIRNIVIGSVP